jgi:hypothetical protein
MNELFKLPERLPESPPKVPMFRATRFKSMGSRDESYSKSLARRLRAAQRSFGVEGDVRTEGARLVVRSGAASLELYRASDSLWWTDHGLAYQEAPRKGDALPDEGKAGKLAAALLETHGVDVSLAKVARVTHVEADTQRGEAKPRSQRTAVDVNYTFSLDKYPVMGPGAKIKVTFVGDGTPAQLIYFWRTPAKASAAAAISASVALERFMRDPSFFRLRNKEAVVEVKKMTLGYYAMSPTDFQRLYVPVWAIDAACITRELRYDFRNYVVAVDMSAERAKETDAVPDPRACRLF